MSKSWEEFEGRLEKARLSKKGDLICRYIRENYASAIRITLGELARELDVSDVTIIRLAKQLGYSGFREMQSDLQRIAESYYSRAGRGALPLSELESSPVAGSADQNRLITSVMEDSVSNITAARDANAPEVFCQAAEVLFSSRRVFLAGFWKCMPLVRELEIRLSYVCENLFTICDYEPNEFLRLIGADESDCLLIYAFHRFPKGVWRILRLALEQQMRVVVITDDAAAWSAYRGIVVLETTRKGEYFSNMLGASYINEVLAAMVTDTFMERRKEQEDGQIRSRAISGMVLDMDYFSEWPNVFMHRDFQEGEDGRDPEFDALP